MVLELMVLRQGFAKRYGGGGGVEEGEGLRQGKGVWLPSLPFTIYRGKGWRRRPRVPYGRGGGHRGNPRWDWAPHP